MSKPTTKAKESIEPFTLEDLQETWIEVKNLIIRWPGAQRRLKTDAHAKAIAANFNALMFGTIIVTLPDERGYYHVVDGFNRVQAVTMIYGPDTGVPCKVLPISDPKEAATVFLGINDAQHRKLVGPIDTFRAGVTAEHPDKVAINKIIRSLGYRVDSSRAENTISAVQALQKVYLSYGAENLKNSLELIQATWGKDPNAPIGPIIQGYATWIAQYGSKANWQRLSDNLAKRYTPGSLLGAARTLKEAERGTLNEAMVRIMVNNYNRGLKSGTLKP